MNVLETKPPARSVCSERRVSHGRNLSTVPPLPIVPFHAWRVLERFYLTFGGLTLEQFREQSRQYRTFRNLNTICFLIDACLVFKS